MLKRNELARKNVELERLTMAINENIVTPEVKANGYGGIDDARFARAVEQIALAYKFKGAKPKPEDIFDSVVPAVRCRKSQVQLRSQMATSQALLDALENAHVVRHRRPTHVEDAPKTGILHLQIASACP